MKARVGGLVGIAEVGEIDGVVFDGEGKECAGHAMEADGQAGVPRKSCAVGVDRHGNDLPGGGLNGDGGRAGMKRGESKLGATTGQIGGGINLERERNCFVAGAAEIDGRVDRLWFEGVVELGPLDAAGAFELFITVVVVGGGATERSGDGGQEDNEEFAALHQKHTSLVICAGAGQRRLECCIFIRRIRAL